MVPGEELGGHLIKKALGLKYRMKRYNESRQSPIYLRYSRVRQSREKGVGYRYDIGFIRRMDERNYRQK